MIALLSRAALLMLVVCVGMVGGARVLSARETGLRIPFADDCAPAATAGDVPCFMGIRAGETSLSEATRRGCP
jgi:hypothetical protein